VVFGPQAQKPTLPERFCERQHVCVPAGRLPGIATRSTGRQLPTVPILHRQYAAGASGR
jgi:hypothetical protein